MGTGDAANMGEILKNGFRVIRETLPSDEKLMDNVTTVRIHGQCSGRATDTEKKTLQVYFVRDNQIIRPKRTPNSKI